MSTIVKVKPIKKDGAWMGFTRYRNTKDSIAPYYDSTGIRYTGLTEEKQKYFEDKLKQKDLSPSSPFWDEYRVIMTDKEREFNILNPEHELAVEFLREHKRIKKSISDMNPYAEYEIVDEVKEAELINTKAAIKRKANKLFDSLTPQQKKDMLKLYPGFVKVEQVSDEIVDARLYEKLEEDPKKFVSIVEDNKRDMKVFLKDLVQADILRKNKSAYYYGNDPLGHDEESTITYLDDKQHQALKVQLMQELKSKNK